MKPKPYIVLGATVIVMLLVLLIGSNISSTGKAYHIPAKSDYITEGTSCDGSGQGTISDPYEIRTCLELQSIRLSPDADFEICSDIDCSDTIEEEDDRTRPGFIPIGINHDNAFTGNLDGNGFEISNLHSRYSGTFCGLFGYAKDSSIRDLYIRNSQFTGKCDYIGAIAGYTEDSDHTLLSAAGIIENSKQNSFSGGLFGFMKASAVTNSEGLMLIEGTGVGGIAGLAEDSTLYEVHSQSTLKGTRTGGLTAILIGSRIEKSFSYSMIEGTGAGISAVARGSEIKDSFAMGDLTGEKVAGIVVELESSTIQDSYFRGSFFSEDASGIASTIEDGSAIVSSFFDKEVAGIEGEQGKTTAEMKEKQTYQGWNFKEVWGMNSKTHNGFPYHI